METKNISKESFQKIVGKKNVVEAKSEDAVEGVQPSLVVKPGSVEEISSVMKLAHEEGLAVAPRGSGTKMHLGAPPRELDLVVSTERMKDIIEYVPGDQVVRVQAGMKLADLQKKLGKSNQMLAIDPLEQETTIGGLIATNASGPRRYSSGTVRDLIIGVRVVLADGTVAKAGSKVVKNVAGYDLSKLFTGSLGTLGIIAEANFRLHPIRDVSRTVIAKIEGGPAEIHAAADAVVRTQAEPTAIELRYGENEKLISVLAESIEGGIEAKVQTISNVLGAHGTVRNPQDGDQLGYALPETREDDALLKISAPPAELAAVLDSVLGAAERGGLNHPKMTGHAGTGVTFVSLSGGDIGAKAETVDELREIWGRRGGSVVLLEAPRELKEKVGVWGAPRDDIGLMGRVKDKFDSRGLMNPGRFVGGI